MSRKLATIQVIAALNPIKKADKIEVATVLGWRTVVKKGDFQVGDKCVFFEVDSILPELPEFKFLEDYKYRLRTLTMRGQISQGLAMPLSILNAFPDLEIDPRTAHLIHQDSIDLPVLIRTIISPDPEYSTMAFSYPLEEGLDLTDILGIVKYEEEVKELERGILGKPFPSEYVHHTDLERIQTKPELLNEIQGHEAYALQKIDGYSFTAILRTLSAGVVELLICSQDQQLERIAGYDTPNVYLDIAKEFDIENKLIALMANIDYDLKSVAIQCEIAGPGIRKNKMGLEKKQLFLFNVAFVSDNLQYMCYTDLLRTSNIIGIPTPKVLWEGVFNFQTIDELLEFVKIGEYPNGHPQEGMVIKPMTDVYSEALCGRLQFKVINNDYLIKTGE